jgi:uncharacterized protein (DUF1800 family)
MSRSAKAEAALALHRFGMGPRPGSIAAIEADPRGALIAELDRPAISELAAASLPSSAKAYRAVTDALAKRQAKAIVAKKEQDAKRQQMAEASAMMEGAAPGTGDMAAKMPPEAVPDPGRPIYLEEARIRTAAAFGAEIGFVERLVWFWSNHFCVSADKIRSMSGAYEREAIRPHVLGRFSELLLAAEGHPAMLFYLDQTVSMGANSTAGINRTRGLNENLAREILELHTLGVRTGYTQDDVIGFANISPDGPWCRRATIPSMAASSPSIRACTSPARRRCWENPTTTKRWSRDAPCCAISPPIPRPLRMWRPSWPAISWPTRRRLRWWSGWRRPFSIPAAISSRSPR